MQRVSWLVVSCSEDEVSQELQLPLDEYGQAEESSAYIPRSNCTSLLMELSLPACFSPALASPIKAQ
jgi:hypothetical protein